MTSDIRSKIDSVKVWYHTLDLGGGVETPGVYDMRPFLHHYRFPASLEGKRVLDVGASNGFFSFHFENLGASRVVAVDLRTIGDHDYPRRYLEEQRKLRSDREIEEIDHHEVHGGFEVARSILASRVEMRYHRIYDLPQEMEDRFDLAFLGSVLVHLRDPVGGLEAVHDMLEPGGLAIIATPTDLSQPDRVYAVYVGDAFRCAWWTPSPACLVKMCKVAGFVEVEYLDTFQVTARGPVEIVDHISVVHCRRRAD